MQGKLFLSLITLAVFGLNGCTRTDEPVAAGSIQTPGVLQDDSANATAESAESGAHQLSLEPKTLTTAPPPVSEADQARQKLRADVRTLDAATASRLDTKASSDTKLVFNGSLVMNPGNVFVLKNVAYKAVEVVRSHGQVEVTVEVPGSNELYEAFDRRPLREVSH